MHHPESVDQRAADGIKPEGTGLMICCQMCAEEGRDTHYLWTRHPRDKRGPVTAPAFEKVLRASGWKPHGPRAWLCPPCARSYEHGVSSGNR